MYAAFTRDLERQRADNEETLENLTKRYRKNIIAIEKMHNKCNQDVTNITYYCLFDSFKTFILEDILNTCHCFLL